MSLTGLIHRLDVLSYCMGCRSTQTVSAVVHDNKAHPVPRIRLHASNRNSRHPPPHCHQPLLVRLSRRSNVLHTQTLPQLLTHLRCLLLLFLTVNRGIGQNLCRVLLRALTELHNTPHHLNCLLYHLDRLPHILLL